MINQLVSELLKLRLYALISHQSLLLTKTGKVKSIMEPYKLLYIPLVPTPRY